MAIDKIILLQLSPEEKRQLAFDLLDSIDEDFISTPMPDWKKMLIRERIQNDLDKPLDVLPWNEVRKKYFG